MKPSRAEILLAAVAVACASTPEQMYPGPPRPPEEVAMLGETFGATVFAIDGEKASGSSWALLPGVYDLIVKFRLVTRAPNVYYEVWSYCDVRFDAQAGKSYHANMRTETDGMKTQIEIGVVDASQQLVARATGCTQNRPSL